MKTLIVEDELTNRLLLEKLMLRYGLCDAVPDGKAAFEAFRSASDLGHGYDLVCMDIRMPESDGIDIVKQIRDFEETKGILSNRGAKIIMITGVNSTRELFRSFANLCDAYLAKPIDARRLDKHLHDLRLISPASAVS